MMLIMKKKTLILYVSFVLCACFVSGAAFRMHNGAKTFLPVEGHVFVIDAGHDAVA